MATERVSIIGGGSDDHFGRPGVGYPLGTEQWVFPTKGGTHGNPGRDALA